MPDLVLFLIGLLVTLVVGVAVWSVGLVDQDAVEERDPVDGDS